MIFFANNSRNKPITKSSYIGNRNQSQEPNYSQQMPQEAPCSVLFFNEQRRTITDRSGNCSFFQQNKFFISSTIYNQKMKIISIKTNNIIVIIYETKTGILINEIIFTNQIALNHIAGLGRFGRNITDFGDVGRNRYFRCTRLIQKLGYLNPATKSEW